MVKGEEIHSVPIDGFDNALDVFEDCARLCTGEEPPLKNVIIQFQSYVTNEQ